MWKQSHIAAAGRCGPAAARRVQSRVSAPARGRPGSLRRLLLPRGARLGLRTPRARPGPRHRPDPAPPRPIQPIGCRPPGPAPGPTPAAGLSGSPRVTLGGCQGGVGPRRAQAPGRTRAPRPYPRPRDGHFSDKMGCEALWEPQGSGSPWGRGACDPTPPALPCPGGAQARGVLCRPARRRGGDAWGGGRGRLPRGGGAGTSGVREECWVQRPEWPVCPGQGKTAPAEG